MRPRKLILIFDDDETRRRVLRFVASVRGHYRLRAAAAWPRRPHWDLANAEVAIVRMRDPAAASRTCRKLQRSLTGVRVLLIGPASGKAVAPDVMLPWNATMEQILEALRILAARKRGPRPWKKKPPASVGAGEGEWQGKLPGGMFAAVCVAPPRASHAAG